MRDAGAQVVQIEKPGRSRGGHPARA